MIALVIVAALAADPSQVREVALTSPDPADGLVACMIQAQPTAAKWQAEHPRWRVVAFRCGSEGEKT